MAFALPVDLRANWIFRVTGARSGLGDRDSRAASVVGSRRYSRVAGIRCGLHRPVAVVAKRGGIS